MTQGQDRSALKWLKEDLNELIKQATLILEEFVEKGYQSPQMSDGADLIHKIQGTLKMVQLTGATMLTEEMEAVARTLVTAKPGAGKDSAEALMLALVQLPDYLERLEKGAPDLPFSVLSIINDLRASRDAGLLSETAFFAPHLNQMLVEETGGEPNPELKNIARQLRGHFHKGLLGWYRQIEPEKSLNLIRQVFVRLLKSSGTACSIRIWDAAQALITGVQEESIEPSISVKLLIAHLDREIKYVIEKGEAATECGFALGLLKNILFYIASADTENPVIKKIQEKYDLKEAVKAIGSDTAEGLVDENLLAAVRDAVQEDLTRIKDTIDLYIRGDRAELSSILDLKDIFGKVADTFGMLGQAGIQSRIRKHGNYIQEKVAQGHQPTDDELMTMASDLLFVESTLANLHQLQGKDAIQPDGDLPEGEIDTHIHAALREATLEIRAVKEVLSTYFETPEMNTALEDMPARFTRMAGAFHMIEEDNAAIICREVNRYIQDNLLGQDVPETSDLDLLAEVVTSIEYYMEALQEDSSDRQGILDFAGESLVKLVKSPELAEKLNPSLEPVESETEELTIPRAESIEEAKPEIEALEADEETVIEEAFVEEAEQVEEAQEPVVEKTVAEAAITAEEDALSLDLELSDEIPDELTLELPESSLEEVSVEEVSVDEGSAAVEPLEMEAVADEAVSEIAESEEPVLSLDDLELESVDLDVAGEVQADVVEAEESLLSLDDLELEMPDSEGAGKRKYYLRQKLQHLLKRQMRSSLLK